MKLNNTLIVTLPDFARHFTFTEFWANRRQFVRDMHPSRVYYWSSELADAYAVVATWIDKGEEATDEDREAGCKALETLVGKPINVNDINFSETPDLAAPVIRIQAGKTLDLPAYKSGGASVCLRHHKIEVYGKNGTTAVISIGGRQSTNIASGGFAYVTEAEGCGFIEFLPTHLQNDIYELTAISQEGELGCCLVVRALYNMHQEVISNIVSFALTDDGYIYVNTNGKLVIMSNAVLDIKFTLMHKGNVLYVKSRGNEVLALYSNGILRSTQGIQDNVGVVSAVIDENGKLQMVKA